MCILPHTSTFTTWYTIQTLQTSCNPSVTLLWQHCVKIRDMQIYQRPWPESSMSNFRRLWALSPEEIWCETTCRANSSPYHRDRIKDSNQLSKWFDSLSWVCSLVKKDVATKKEKLILNNSEEKDSQSCFAHSNSSALLLRAAAKTWKRGWR